METDKEESPLPVKHVEHKMQINHSRKEILMTWDILDKRSSMERKPKTCSSVMGTVGALYLFSYIVRVVI